MKNIPFLVFGNLALMIIILFEIFKSWDAITAENSWPAVFVGIAIPVMGIVFSIVYIKKNKL